jgi:hypothetical protein
MRRLNGFTSESGFAWTIQSGSRDKNTFTWYGVCDVPRRPGRSEREEFPGVGHCRRLGPESTKRSFQFFTVPPPKEVPMNIKPNGL